MMKKKVIIIYNESSDNNKKGEFFEDLVEDIFYSQRYSMQKRVNFTGMEIDLIAHHKDRIDEQIYIECKARDNLSVIDIKSFVFDYQMKKVPYGYFISTTEYVHQVAGLIKEISSEYLNIYFWGPDKIIELLEESKKICRINYEDYNISVSKEILIKSYKGIFRVCILAGETYAKHFVVFNAVNNELIYDEDIVEMIQPKIDELEGLNCLRITEKCQELVDEIQQNNEFVYETIAEVKQSENWYDYLPTSKRHFVGRKYIVKSFNDYIQEIKLAKTDKRVFYIEGKSGWGKSSFVSYIRDTYSSKKYCKNYLVFAVDTRSANSNNFVSQAVKGMFEKGMKEKFIQDNRGISIISNYDILESDSVRNILKELKDSNKYMILIFDQFEDIFRKRDVFKTFYKLMLDINSSKENLILGFSWKSEVNIPMNHEAYHLWQMVRNETRCFTIAEFNSKEVSSIIGQMQKSICQPLDLSIKRKITESSQGFPWLTKKLCIHIYNQINMGISMDELIEQDLNIKGLFDADLEKLEPKEVKALKYIAQRAYEGDMFDAMEIDENIENVVISELVNKRLVIKSGTKYNIYWDIFRDYLISGNVPMIGESYILRISATQCLKVFLGFKGKNRMTLNEVTALQTKKNANSTLNVLRELINVGLLYKRGEEYCISCDENSISKDYFIENVRAKFSYYTPIIKLKKYNNGFTTNQIIEELRAIFRGVDISKNTWEIYAKILVGWIYFLGLNDRTFYLKEIGLNEKIPRVKKVKNRAESFTPQKTVEQDINVFYMIVKDLDNLDVHKYNKNLYDLSAIGLLYYWGDTVILSESGQQLASAIDTNDFSKILAQFALCSNKISMAVDIIKKYSIESSKQFKKKGKELVENMNSKVYKRDTLFKIYRWADYICKVDFEDPVY